MISSGPSDHVSVTLPATAASGQSGIASGQSGIASGQSGIASLTLRSTATTSPGPLGFASPTEETINSSDDDTEAATDQASANFEMKYTTPVQDKLKAEIDTLRNKMEQLQNFKTSGFASTENINELEESKTLLEKKEDQVKKKRQQAAIRSQNYRKRRSDTMETIAVKSEENAKKNPQASHTWKSRPTTSRGYISWTT